MNWLISRRGEVIGTVGYMQKEYLMFQRLLGLVLVLGVWSPAIADDLPPFPKQVPPIVGTAVVADAGNGTESSEWQIALTVPQIQWEIVGELIAKKEWPQLTTQVKKVKLDIVMGGPSQLAESQVMDIKGNTLGRVRVTKRLENETPVVVSVSGEMPDAYFLQLTNADALIIVLGPRDGYPAPGFLPAKKEAVTKSYVEGDR